MTDEVQDKALDAPLPEDYCEHCGRLYPLANLASDAAGVPIGVKDRKGNPIHIGDELRFDAMEWGEPMAFIVVLEEGEIRHPGSTSDLTEWCEVIRRWDAPPFASKP